MTKSNTHVVTVPEIIWKWAQRKSGKTNPAGWIREKCFYATMIADIQNPNDEPEQPSTLSSILETRWEALGMDFDAIDTEFNTAKHAFINQMGDETKAVEWFEKGTTRGIQRPRAWIIDWYHTQQPRAI